MRNTRQALVSLVVAGAAVFSSTPLWGQMSGGPYEIRPLDINGGGQTSTGGPYAIDASTAQAGGVGTILADPVPPPPTYQLDDGFWGATLGVPGCPCVVDADCKDPICADNSGCNCADCAAGVCVFTCQGFGNSNCTGPVDLDDILCTLNGFGNFNLCPDADINPCSGNGVIDLDDILDVLTAFGGGNPCGCDAGPLDCLP